MKYKQQGMTLVEVLIAGIILFISISVISMVARTKALNELKLVNVINHAYLAEYSQKIIKYHLKYTNNREGQIFIGGTEYSWHSEIEDSKPITLTLDNDENANENQQGNVLNLYNVVITNKNNEKAILKYVELIWESP